MYEQLSVSKRLLIIGNGVDLAHGLRSEYLSFKNFLENEYGCVENRHLVSPCVTMNNHGEEVVSRKEAAQFLYNLMQTTLEQNELEWKDFEDSLSYINLSEVFDWNLFNEYSDDEIKNESVKQLNTELLCEKLIYIISLIPGLFQEWIENDVEPQLQNTKKLQHFDDFIKLNNDVFLSFNYTSTLETLYGVDNVAHFHGKIGDKKYIIGHGNYKEINYNFENIDCVEDMKKYDTESKIRSMFKKPVNDVIKNNDNFFNEIKDVEEIAVIGWNYKGEVDYPYFEKIIKNANGAKWTLFYYDSEKADDCKKNEEDAKLFSERFNLEAKIKKSSEILC